MGWPRSLTFEDFEMFSMFDLSLKPLDAVPEH